METLWQKAQDAWLFRRRSESGEPEITAGTIVYGAVLRTLVLLLGTLALLGVMPDLWRYAWLVLLALWGVVVYPAYQRWREFSERVEQLKEELLCGSCRYFEETGQLCTLLDEHVRSDYIPCEGLSWEPRTEWDE
jgi:hypothetical protein